MIILLVLLIAFFALILIKKNHNKKNIKNVSIPKYIRKRLSDTIGITSANCPYCGAELKIFPSKKTKCTTCKKNIYKRIRPYDKKPILVREDQLNELDLEAKKKRFMLTYACNDFEKFETKLQKIRKTNDIPFNDVIWYKYQEQYKTACSKLNFSEINSLHWYMADFLLNEEQYKNALNEYLVSMFWNACLGGNNTLASRSLFDDKELLDSHLKAQISFFGNPGRCLEYVNLSEKELIDTISDMKIEQGLPFPFSINDVLPYYQYAYKQHQIEKKKFEEEYKIHYLIGGKIE